MACIFLGIRYESESITEKQATASVHSYYKLYLCPDYNNYYYDYNEKEACVYPSAYLHSVYVYIC